MALSSPRPSSSSVVLLLSVDAGLRRRALTSFGGVPHGWDGQTRGGDSLEPAGITQARVTSPLIGSWSEQISQRLSRICQALLALVKMAEELEAWLCRTAQQQLPGICSALGPFRHY